MKVTYQGRETEAGENTVAGFLEAAGVERRNCIVEFDGDILPLDAQERTPLREGARLEAFRIVPGG